MTDQIKTEYRKKRKTYNIEGHTHELTFSCYHQYDYLNDPKCCTIFMEELLSAREKYFFHLWAYILMPSHVHLLIYPYRGGFDRNLWNAKAIHASINYIEANSVRKDLVENPEDWEWSSAWARRYQVSLVPDDFNSPVLMK